MKIEQMHFEKLGGILPAVVQDADTGEVLMVGFMNRESLQRTLGERRVTFWSRSKQRVWQKGETSGHYLDVLSVVPDCDSDAVLIQANPHGPTCHTGAVSCFGEEGTSPAAVIGRLENIIEDRKERLPEQSHTAALLREGTGRIAQKVGEEAVEVALAAVQEGSANLIDESADLVYHLLVLLRQKGIAWRRVTDKLRERMKR